MGLIGKLFLWFSALFLVLVVSAGVGAWMLYQHFSENLPQIDSLADYRPPVITTVYSDDLQKIGEFYRERRIVVPLPEIPRTLINAFVAAEDDRFWEHEGVDLVSITRAFFKNLEARTIVQGGSTITQQVTKSFLLTPERSYTRKIREAILAYRIDQKFEKEDILYLYLNQIYLGHGAYGVAAAAGNYFGKPVADLTLAESAVLAGLPQAPSRYSPYKHPERARERQEYVLQRMVEEGYITREEADAALKEPLNIHPVRNWFQEQVPYYAEHVRQYVAEKYGEEMLYTGGLKIYTAVNIEMQKAARKAIAEGLRELDHRHSGYRGPVRHLETEEVEPFLAALREDREKNGDPEAGGTVQGVVTAVDTRADEVSVRMGIGEGTISFRTMTWGTKKAGRKSRSGKVEDLVVPGDVILVNLKEKNPETGTWDLRLEQTPEAQSALLCLETGTGYVKAMVGGRDFRESQFNRALQARRQPGSAFKPIVYAAALDAGYTPATEIIDNAVVYKDASMTWKPKNYDRKFHGPILLRKALAKSRNLSTIKVLDDIGINYAIKYARKLGIHSDLTPTLSLALGSSGVSLLELTTAYSVFANYGERVKPVFITRIVDRDGNELEGLDLDSEKVIDESTAYLMTSLLESVVQEGTGRKVKALGRPTAGKTGTTNNLRDAWFMGYTPGYVTGVWVGFDQERPLGPKETGGRAASPIWLDYMQTILKDEPVLSFRVPKGVVFSKIDAKTGLLQSSGTRQTIFECFKAGTIPTVHSKGSDAVAERDDFFKTGM